jgi:diketogulonate reductase-like aldo/keto reductase
MNKFIRKIFLNSSKKKTFNLSNKFNMIKVSDYQIESIPKLGFGTYMLTGELCYLSTRWAVKNGYTHIDTASGYGNEHVIGTAIEGFDRKNLWLTTKIHPDDISQGKTKMYQSISQSLQRLNTDYLDLVLLHVPVGDNKTMIANWKAMEDIIFGNVPDLKDKVRFIGISNYDVNEMKVILSNCRIQPYVNQFRANPYYPEKELIGFCKKNQVRPIAHTSLGRGKLIRDPRLETLSKETGISIPNLLLGWGLQQDLGVLPRSSHPFHIANNLKCLDVKLTNNIMDNLNKLELTNVVNDMIEQLEKN